MKRAGALLAAGLALAALLWLLLDAAHEPAHGAPIAPSTAETAPTHAPLAGRAAEAPARLVEPAPLDAPSATAALAPAPPAETALLTRFVRPDGTPRADLELLFETLPAADHHEPLPFVSDARGEVRVGDLARHRTYAWRCVDPGLRLIDVGDEPPAGWAAAHPPGALADAARAQLFIPDLRSGATRTLTVIVVDSLRALTGTVIGPDGAPRADVRLRLWRRRANREASHAATMRARFARSLRAPPPAWTLVEWLDTAPDSRFRFEHAPAGELRLTGAFSVDERELQVLFVEVDMPADRSLELGALDLARHRPPRTLRLETRLDGEPVSAERVWQRPEELVLLPALEDAGDQAPVGLADRMLPVNTDLRVHGLPDGTWLTEVGGQLDGKDLKPGVVLPIHGLGGESLTLQAADDLLFVVPFSSWVEVFLEVTDRTGLSTPRDLTLEFYEPDLSVVFEHPGRLPLPAPPASLVCTPGERVLVVRDGGELYHPRPDPVIGVARFTVTAPGPVSVPLLLSRGLTLTGTLRDPAGAPVPGARLELWPAGSSSDAPTDAVLAVATTDESGVFRMEHVPARTLVELRHRATHDRLPRLGEAFTTGAPNASLVRDVVLAPDR